MICFKKNKHNFLFICLLVLSVLSFSGCKKVVPVSDNIGVDLITAIPSPIPTKVPTKVPISITPTVKAAEPEPEIIETQELTILAVGDDLIHIQVVESGLQEDGSYNFDHLFSILKTDIEAADIAIINQETILGGSEFSYSGYPVFNSPTELGNAIIKAGFDVVLHATNHAMDMNEAGIENTLEYWSAHPEITVLGLNDSAKKQEEITVIEKNGIKVAMLNYTFGLNGYSLPSDKPYLVNLLNKDKVTEDIAAAKELSDFVIVFPHWGTEYEFEPDEFQKEWTTFFAEQGVDLVIGTHPHVLEPVEWIETESGHKMLVYYSLGNYVSYQREAPRMLGGIAHVTLTKDGESVYVSHAGITPIVTHYETSDDYNYGVYKLSDYSEEKALLHGILDLEEDSLFTFEGTQELATKIVGDWVE
jgi:poly-gamma-glutamate capsule biosynthesis protein CapA/YwtB (metallophosphatase superfamily)